MSIRLVESVIGVGLLAHAAYQFQTNPSWYIYTPFYTLSAILAIVQLTQNSIWRLFSAVSIVFGGLLSIFLQWTFSQVEETPSLDLAEGKNLLPVALGAVLSSFIRISDSKPEKPIHYLRNAILYTVFGISTLSLVTSIKYL